MNGAEAMEHLFTGYFNLDWADLYDDPWAVVDAFMTDEPEVLGSLAVELRRVLREVCTEDGIRDLLQRDLACGYYPPADGWTYRSWLTAVAERVQRASP